MGAQIKIAILESRFCLFHKINHQSCCFTRNFKPDMGYIFSEKQLSSFELLSWGSMSLWFFTQLSKGSEPVPLHVFILYSNSTHLWGLSGSQCIPGHMVLSRKFQNWQLRVAQIDSTSALSKPAPSGTNFFFPPPLCKSVYAIRGWNKRAILEKQQKNKLKIQPEVQNTVMGYCAFFEETK